jgi:hypothetical protein
MFVHINLVFACEECPDSDVELPSFEEKGTLDVFLDDAARELRSRVDEKLQFLKV